MENHFMLVVCLVNDIWSSKQRCQIYWKGNVLERSFSMKCVSILEILPVVEICNSCIFREILGKLQHETAPNYTLQIKV